LFSLGLMRRVVPRIVIAAAGALALSAVIVANQIWQSRLVACLIWLTSAPVVLLAELVRRCLPHFGFDSAVLTHWQQFGLCGVASFIWISFVFCSVLFRVRIFGDSVRFSQGCSLALAPVISITCWYAFDVIFVAG
jgi:hypothetical protein